MSNLGGYEAIIESINPEHTLYAIHLNLEENHLITIGKLGMFSFHKGTYIYVGSAQKNIRQRIERHKKINKKIHWHFDYLRPFGIITRIITYDQSFGECELAENIRKQLNGTIPIRGFGSSDCKCISHLILVENYLFAPSK